MLTFTVNNKAFILSQETSIRLTWVNPACMFDDFPGDVGMGISIPVNEHNRAILGYQNAVFIRFVEMYVTYAL